MRRFLTAAVRRLHWKSKMELIFSSIFETNAWSRDGSESVSGPGSEGLNVTAIKRELPSLLKDLRVGTMLDVPCGDFNWMKEVQLSLEQYIGADVVSAVIHRNRKLYGRPNRQFKILDITKSNLPHVDLILCRDCLVHFSYQHIHAAFKRFKESGSSYLLTTTFTNPRENIDIETGEWRTLNLQKSPFSLPAPLRVISDEYVGEGGVYKDKKLGLWKVSDLGVS